MKARISKAYRGHKHVGWKKTVGNREWFLGSGTSPADEAKAIRLAEALEAKWQWAKIAGASELSATEFNEARDLVEGRQIAKLAAQMRVPSTGADAEASNPPSEPAPPVTTVRLPEVLNPCRRRLFASLDEFVANFMLTLKPDMSNGDHFVNTRDRVIRAKDATQDVPLDLLARKELDTWLLSIRNLKSKVDGKPLGAPTVRNLVGSVRMALTTFAEWQWWMPPLLWERAFRNYTIKRMQTTAERKKSKQRPPAHSVTEKRILWNTALDFTKAMMAIADWAGHTQKEAATLTFDEIQDEAGEMYIDRDRNKTGVYGRWRITGTRGSDSQSGGANSSRSDGQRTRRERPVGDALAWPLRGWRLRDFGTLLRGRQAVTVSVRDGDGMFWLELHRRWHRISIHRTHLRSQSRAARSGIGRIGHRRGRGAGVSRILQSCTVGGRFRGRATPCHLPMRRRKKTLLNRH